MKREPPASKGLHENREVSGFRTVNLKNISIDLSLWCDLRRHSATLLRAAFTCFGARLAMILLMLATFVTACLTNVRAGFADSSSESTATAHKRCGCSTNFCAIKVQGNATRHHFYVRFLQARSGAMVASGCAVITGLDTCFEFFMRHIFLLSVVTLSTLTRLVS